LGLIETKYEETLNANFIGNFMSFLKRVGTHNFDTGRRNHEVLKLIGSSR
jgi:hypothetical protein